MFVPHYVIVRQKQAAVIESLGKFDRVIGAGFHFIKPWESLVGRASLKVQELQVAVETKTLDDVFVKLLLAIQYQVIPDRVQEAFYELANPIQQIESYVFDEVRSSVPEMSLDEVFRNKDKIAAAVKANLSETMQQYGYGIVGSLVNDIEPDARVKEAMNEINAAQRLRKAAEEKGEAEKILMVKKAQGEAEANRLHGEGIASQRRAIVDGLRDSVEDFQEGVSGTSTQDVLQLILMTQYFDTLKEVGENSHSNTILIPHSPGGLQSLVDQVRTALMTADAASVSARSINVGSEGAP